MIRQTPGSFAPLRQALIFALLTTLSSIVHGQGDPAPYARKNSFGLLIAYSNDSSHMLLGDAEQRKLLNLGVSYSRRLLLTRFGAWTYDGELLPVALESDPLTRGVNAQTSPNHSTVAVNGLPPMTTCGPLVNNYDYTLEGVVYSGVETFTCRGRQWNIGEATSPAGLQWNFRPRSKIQPLVAWHGGYMYTTRPIPISYAGSFNFTFDIDAGVEYYRSYSRSIRVEYRYHHISNHDTAVENPGIDSGVFQISYVFGR